MKNKLSMRFLISVAGIVALAFSAVNAFAVSSVTNKSSVVSPFWQSDGSVYTFIAVSHSSLAGMNSEVGVKLSAFDEDGTSFSSTSFTVTENTTTKVFLVSTNHSTINSLTVTTNSSTILLSGTTNLVSGHVTVTSVASKPFNLAAVPGTAASGQARDATMLTYWGSVVVPGNNTGFAMEFIGDTHDSASAISTVGDVIPVGVN